MSNRPVLQGIALVAALAAAYVSYLLLAEHLTGSTGISFFDAACTVGGEQSKADCEEVLKSPYGVWPFIKEGDPKDMRRTPVALIGMMYYSMVAVWLVGIGRPAQRRMWLHALPTFVIFGSLLGCGYFIYIMYTATEAWCPLCMVTHGLNLLIFICFLWMWRRPKRLVAVEQTAATAAEESLGHEWANPINEKLPADQPDGPSYDESPAHPPAEPLLDDAHAGTSPLPSTPLTPSTPPVIAAPLHPSLRQVVVTFIALYLVWFGQSMLYAYAEVNPKARNCERGLNRCMAKLTEIKGDAKKLMKNWQLGEKHKFAITDDAKRRGGKEGGKTLKCVIFSDFECAFCKVFAEYVEQKIQPLFAGELEVIFKHYPLSKECNQHVKHNPHPNSCKGAIVAEAVRMQGGNKAFWRAHDYLFDKRRKLKKLTAEEITEALDLDLEQFLQDYKSEECKKAVMDDIEEGAKAKIKATPAIYVNGRHVNSLAVTEIDFWDEMANLYWRTIKKKRPPETQLDAIKATQDSQDQPAAP